ncbi:MAG: gamma-glutamyl-gamma-aminobutyrate hydrolase family protein [Erysipelotrichaceae bacterium]|nr:gamma-glutamyl-gamma-aminobutyrate hydrolase family protein [Erysipelotrichaceae bacterium]
MKLRIAIPLFERLKNYEDALQQLGAIPCPADKLESIEDYDGLLLPGGGDVDPARYGQQISGSYPDGIDKALDELQFSFLEAFVKAGKPVLGICRGQQLINVYFGGTLIQHLPNADERHSCPVDGQDYVHDVDAVCDSYLSEIYGRHFSVNSNHHQAIDRLADGFKVQLVDGEVIEAIQHETLPIIAVQFHPERMCFNRKREDTVDGQYIIATLLKLCENR